MIKRLLIANRGEIAVRIARACREMGVESVAVYSEADRDALHAAVADHAVMIGPAAAADSYLSIPALLEAARKTRADAVHPGYGFLSERAPFAEACEKAGLVFVGPPASVIAQMGSKIAARQMMERGGVPVVPGGTPRDQSDEGLAAAIERVGLPALIKPSSGGGGKGMHRVRERSEISRLVQAARREATAAFGDGTLYVERLIERPHHVEVQVLGDHQGNVTHLFERECSLQRRHQKVIEESPSPIATPALRKRMTEAAVTAAKTASYRNAGTVEFLVDLSAGAVDSNTPFYFLEMNTRLQVEHPVTEQVAGVDLVHAQLRVASGETLPWAAGSLSQRGHAIEARVYAEDPSQNFLPQAGRLLLYREPRRPGIRVDSGFAEGHAVPIHYDPLIAKVIASAETRDEAIARLVAALREFPILGIQTNIPFLLRILEHPTFRNGEADTGFLDREGDALARIPDEPIPAVVAAAVLAHGNAAPEAGPDLDRHQQAWDPWRGNAGWRP